jgi:hypothetical protein
VRLFDARDLVHVEPARTSPMTRVEIHWTRTTDEGEKQLVEARQVGSQWTFFVRPSRRVDWEPVEAPTLEDWLGALDGVQRLAQRKLYDVREVPDLEALIRKRFPKAKF